MRDDCQWLVPGCQSGGSGTFGRNSGPSCRLPCVKCYEKAIPMARRSRMTILKRQRELKKAEKAAHKRAKRHGVIEEGSTEPTPTAAAAELLGLRPITPKPQPKAEE